VVHTPSSLSSTSTDSSPPGMRSNCDLFIYLDVSKMLAGPFPPLFPLHRLTRVDGVPLFTSTNNVVLTPGIEGVVGPKYFLKVVDKNGKVPV
jgi:2'-phosphotransferase